MRHPLQRLPTLLAAACALLLALSSCGSCDDPLPVEGDPCQTIADCQGVEGLSCTGGICEEIACTRSRECPANAACVRRLCQAADCSNDADCKPRGDRFQCFEGACRDDLCEDPTDCAEGNSCRGEPRRCLPPPASCSSDPVCPVNQGCKLPQNQCQPFCSRDSDCEGEQYCDGRFCRGRCISAEDCSPGSVCRQGRCTLNRCEEQADSCSPALPFRDPVGCDCVECLEDQDCDFERGELCAEGGRCLRCESFGQDEASCQAQSLFLAAEDCCVNCLQDIDCPQNLNLVCQRGDCIPAELRACSQDSDCPEGEVCDGARCRTAASLQACQKQADCPDEEACYADGRCRAEGSCDPGCQAPSRCAAESADQLGSCLGCMANCQEEGCAKGLLCIIPDGQSEGYCIAAEAAVDLCPQQ